MDMGAPSVVTIKGCNLGSSLHNKGLLGEEGRKAMDFPSLG